MFLLRRKIIFELSPIPLSYLELYLAMLRASDRMRFEDISEFFLFLNENIHSDSWLEKFRWDGSNEESQRMFCADKQIMIP